MSNENISLTPAEYDCLNRLGNGERQLPDDMLKHLKGRGLWMYSHDIGMGRDLTKLGHDALKQYEASA